MYPSRDRSAAVVLGVARGALGTLLLAEFTWDRRALGERADSARPRRTRDLLKSLP